jgi:hypothetical protein
VHSNKVVNDPFIQTFNNSVPSVGPLNEDVGFILTGSANSYLGASDQLRRIGARVLTNGEQSVFPSPCGANCTYNVTFLGPAYQCDVHDPNTPLPNLTSPNYPGLDPSLVNGGPPIFFWATELFGNLSIQGLWVSHGVIANNATTHCTLYNATYSTQVNFTNNIAVLNTSLQYYQQLDTSYITQNISVEKVVGLYETGQGNDTYFHEIWQNLNFYTVHRAVVELLQGYVVLASAQGGYIFKDTMIGIADFTNNGLNNFSVPQGVEFSRLMETFIVNTTLSTVSFLQRPAIEQNDWSTTPDKTVTQPAEYVEVQATTKTYPATYAYDRVVFWEAYAAAIGVSAVCVAIGIYMLLDNGVDADTSFSQILATTRNPTFDRLCADATDGGMISEELEKTNVKFGMLKSAEGHLGFGLEQEILPLKGKFAKAKSHK